MGTQQESIWTAPISCVVAQTLADYLKTLGFTLMHTDQTVFVRADEDGLPCIIAIYVDDLLITAKNDALVTEVKGLLKERFKIKELGPINWILGIAVERDFMKSTLIMHQQKYIMDLVERFGMENTAGRRTPYS